MELNAKVKMLSLGNNNSSPLKMPAKEVARGKMYVIKRSKCLIDNHMIVFHCWLGEVC